MTEITIARTAASSPASKAKFSTWGVAERTKKWGINLPAMRIFEPKGLCFGWIFPLPKKSNFFNNRLNWQLHYFYEQPNKYGRKQLLK